MYSLISKISSSVRIKDGIAIIRGLSRIAAAPSYPQFQAQPWNYKKRIIQQPLLSQKSDLLINKNVEKTIETVQNIVQNQKRKLIIQQSQTNISQKNNNQNYLNQKQNNSSDIHVDWGKTQKSHLQQSKVIDSRMGRFFEYVKLGKTLVECSVGAYVAKKFNPGKQQQIYEQGAKIITNQLCKMRGAPLKVAQMLSIQEDNLIPASIRKAFQKARQTAHIMTQQQLIKCLKDNLGQNWLQKFSKFDLIPFASASIGQVHRALSKENKLMALKIQYPGVFKSIQSDINNLKVLLKLPGVLPKGIYIQKILASTERQLKQQCDYIRQAKMHNMYDKCLKQSMKQYYKNFKVPRIYKELSTKQFLASEYLQGIALSKIQNQSYSQQIRNRIGFLLMKLTFNQIFQMGIMQSDPNPSNFTYNIQKDQLNLFDFGATHIYQEEFLQAYASLINSSVKKNIQDIKQYSIKSGFLTGDQNKIMLEQHTESILLLGQPLRHQGIYDFGQQKITQKIYKSIPIMLKNRLKAPPEQIYSLHRKLSGSYLACIRLGAQVDCNKIYKQMQIKYLVKKYIDLQ